MKREWGTRRTDLRRPALLGPVVLLLGLCVAVVPGPVRPTASAAPATPAVARAASGTTPYKVVTHNVLRKRSAVDAAIAQGQRYGAEAIFLQELCRDDFEALQKQFASRWTLSFQPKGVHTGGGVRVCLDERDDQAEVPDGVAAIWTGGPGGVPRRFVLRSQDAPRQDVSTGLACVFTDNARVRLCSVHSVAFDDVVRRDQHEEIRDLTRPWMAGRKLVVLGGDFNAGPKSPEMDPIYAGGRRSAGGQFREVSRADGSDCRCGSKTVGPPAENRVKLDYLFYSAPSTPEDTRRTSYALPDTFTESDHRMLRGYAAVRLP